MIPGQERSPGEGNGNPLQYSFLGNAMDRVTWWYAELDMTLVTKQEVRFISPETKQNPDRLKKKYNI